MRVFKTVGATALIAALAACSVRSPAPLIPAVTNQYLALPALPAPIRHVVIVVQENRTPDFLFQGIKNADISKYATDSQGKRVALHEVSLAAPYDLGHGYPNFVTDYDGGKMDGFAKDLIYKYRTRAFGYGVPAEVQPYHDMAAQYVLGDRMFASHRGPSFPAHLYIVTGTAGGPGLGKYRVRSNPYSPTTGKEVPGGCDASKSIVVRTILPLDGSEGPTPWSCFDRPALSDLLDQKNASWRYYQEGSGPGRWHAFNAIKHVRFGKDWADVVTSSAQFLNDVKAGKLAGVSWVMPAGNWSDHAGSTGTSEGPSWVAAIVNTIGTSKYWNDTAILVTWDDWGGWYDHVAPPAYNYYELGFRVPLLVISPYAKKGYVSKQQHEFGSLLAFTEETFGITKGSLSTTDVRADDLKDAFDFNQKPRAFVRIKAPPFRATINESSYDEDP